jgi:hypothetical protein
MLPAHLVPTMFGQPGLCVSSAAFRPPAPHLVHFSLSLDGWMDGWLAEYLSGWPASTPRERIVIAPILC